MAGAFILAVLAVAIYFLRAGTAPVLAFDKLDVDLGTVTRDQEGIQTFLVMNRGDGPLELGPVDIVAEQGCSEAEVMDGKSNVQPGGNVLLPIHLGPHNELGPHRILMKVPSNDPNRPLTTLSISFRVEEGQSAEQTGPSLRVDKEMIDIGAVPYDWPLYEQFTLRNAGNEPLMLNGYALVRVSEGC